MTSGSSAALARAVSSRVGSPAMNARSGTIRDTKCRAYSQRPSFLPDGRKAARSEEHTSELQSLMRISYAVFCSQKKTVESSKQRLYDNDQTRTTYQSKAKS